MKTTVTLILIAFISITGFSQNSGTLEIDGFASYRNGALNNVYIEVYKDGQPYMETESNRSGEFELMFEGAGNYIVKASKEGFHDRFILFDTHTSGKGYKREKYDFGLELFKTKDEMVDAQNQDIPVIEYNPSKKNFSYASMM